MLERATMMGKRGMWSKTIVATGLMMALLMGNGCAAQPSHTVQIEGKVLGEPMKYDSIDPGHPDPINGMIACNGATTQIVSGEYRLSVARASHYDCVVSADQYVSQTATLPSNNGTVFTLDFGVTSETSCTRGDKSGEMECDELRLMRGSINGLVMDTNGHPVATGFYVDCSPVGPNPEGTGDIPIWRSTSTDVTGTYTLSSLYPGTYGCIVTTNGKASAARQTAIVRGGIMTKADFHICLRHCPPVHYHLGPVMHSYTAYLIYWLPKSYTFESGGNSRFESATEQYFKDIGGTSFYGILSQYWDYRGPVQNSVNLGGVYVDTTPYDSCDPTLANCRHVAATRKQPLHDDDILAEIVRALQVNTAWRAGPDTEFFVFTGLGAEECDTADNSSCTFLPYPHGFCGYHSSSDNTPFEQSSGASIIYAYIPDPGTDLGECPSGSGWAGPHHDAVVDSVISTISHEQFESVSDPYPDTTFKGWYDDIAAKSPDGGEIGDKCAWNFGSIGADGGNVTLAHGHRYLLQAEWSNRSNGCAFK